MSRIALFHSPEPPELRLRAVGGLLALACLLLARRQVPGRWYALVRPPAAAAHIASLRGSQPIERSPSNIAPRTR